MLCLYNPDITTTLAQRRQRWHNRRCWHNVAMVAVGTTTLEKRHLVYVGPTSEIALGQRLFASHMPTMSAMLEKIRSENTCSSIF